MTYASTEEGLGILSKVPLNNVASVQLPLYHPQADSNKRIALHAELELLHRTLHLFVTHFTYAKDDQLADATAVWNWMQSFGTPQVCVTAADAPTLPLRPRRLTPAGAACLQVLLGDFNVDSSYSDPMDFLTGRLWVNGTTGALTDAWEVLSPSAPASPAAAAAATWAAATAASPQAASSETASRRATPMTLEELYEEARRANSRGNGMLVAELPAELAHATAALELDSHTDANSPSRSSMLSASDAQLRLRPEDMTYCNLDTASQPLSKRIDRVLYRGGEIAPLSVRTAGAERDAAGHVPSDHRAVVAEFVHRR